MIMGTGRSGNRTAIGIAFGCRIGIAFGLRGIPMLGTGARWHAPALPGLPTGRRLRGQLMAIGTGTMGIALQIQDIAARHTVRDAAPGRETRQTRAAGDVET
jgi:hypothetical protein